MRWSELGLSFGPPPAADPTVAGVVYDSRSAGPGLVFVAVHGAHQDGHQFVGDALRAGSPAAVVETFAASADPGRQVVVPDTLRALAQLAAAVHRHPSREVPVVGVTGTDGKTTTTTLLQAALSPGLGPVGSLTTVDFRIGGLIEPNLSRQSTLEAPEVQGMMRRMVDSGCRAIALESTSHGLALHRLDEIDFAGAVYTNITHEHLDFHKTWEAYFEAKASLLDRTAAGGGFAVLNHDDQLAFPRLLPRAPRRCLTYSATGSEGADLRASRPVAERGGLSFSATTPAGPAEVRLRMAGRWNVSNALAALAAGLLLDQPLAALVDGLAALAAVPGRMESVDLGQPFSVVVDYAHTPAALTLALYELRPATAGRLWVVFGSAGERDRAKRKEMGRIAAQLADQVVVTSEDPRGENALAIIEEICAGARDAGASEEVNLHRESDRAAAIRLAVERALPGDTVLLAGKGHEHSIIGAQGPVPWDEVEAAEAAIRRRLAGGAP